MQESVETGYNYLVFLITILRRDLESLFLSVTSVQEHPKTNGFSAYMVLNTILETGRHGNTRSSKTWNTTLSESAKKTEPTEV